VSLRTSSSINLVATLEQLPSRRFDSAADTMQAVSEIGEYRWPETI
jgi:hypothetical protein